ncbi:hypothetical protein [Sphingomonas yabuuchiae]|nr:hypothetical protein [Sphingomonas yabuuchiae]
MADFCGSYPPNDPPSVGKDNSKLPEPVVMNFAMVEDRLVEALLTCWRTPDREQGWQQLRSAWPEITRDPLSGDYDARGGDGSSSDVPLRLASQTREEVAEMEEAFGWLSVLDADDRKLVGLAVAQLAAGKREISWVKMLRRMGLDHGADGLRMRYGRALAAIIAAQNRRKAGVSVSSG